ncbi:MAG: QacE family quaternary ammonium compound efflux SMR transporter [Xanthomonadaceae bacterium]|jgi:small multidrug resistance pump|nr:QacE family quaternary ammonium compound efflux SMR transporter [Xanthomonadaceae bacterium]
MKIGYLYLAAAIMAEVVATSALKASDGFTRLLPTMVVLAGYGIAFYFLSLVIKTVPMGVSYAIWSGAGIVLISALGWLIYRQTLDFPAIVGITLILCGVLIIQLFSKSSAH